MRLCFSKLLYPEKIDKRLVICQPCLTLWSFARKIQLTLLFSFFVFSKEKGRDVFCWAFGKFVYQMSKHTLQLRKQNLVALTFAIYVTSRCWWSFLICLTSGCIWPFVELYMTPCIPFIVIHLWHWHMPPLFCFVNGRLKGHINFAN